LDQKTKFLPILGYGERLIHPITRSSGGEGPQFPRTYEQARQLVKQQINVLKSNIRDIPAKKRMREVVATVRLNSKFLAKSYIPNSFFRESNMENIGSRRWVYFTSLFEKPVSIMKNKEIITKNTMAILTKIMSIYAKQYYHVNCA